MRTSVVALGLFFVLSSGCIGPGVFARRHWDLLVTEVGKRQVELYMDEPSSSALNLSGLTFEWTGANGDHGELDLGAFTGAMAGGTFLVIWEESGYMDPPVDAPFTMGASASVPGIKVAEGFFHDIDGYPSEVRVHGERVTASIAHRVDDVFRFDLPESDRPVTGGNFTDDGTQSASPSGSGSLQRMWSGSVPLDTDSESDWRPPTVLGTGSSPNWGAKTP